MSLFIFYRVSSLALPILKGKSQTRSLCTETKDEPVRFSTSQARKWRVRQTFGPGAHPKNYRHEFFRLVLIIGSIIIFLVYFCILREENDIDEELEVPLINRIKGLEESQLRQAIEFNKSHGISTKELEQRLKEIELEKYYNVTQK